MHAQRKEGKGEDRIRVSNGGKSRKEKGGCIQAGGDAKNDQNAKMRTKGGARFAAS